MKKLLVLLIFLVTFFCKEKEVVIPKKTEFTLQEIFPETSKEESFFIYANSISEDVKFSDFNPYLCENGYDKINYIVEGINIPISIINKCELCGILRHPRRILLYNKKDKMFFNEDIYEYNQSNMNKIVKIGFDEIKGVPISFDLQDEILDDEFYLMFANAYKNYINSKAEFFTNKELLELKDEYMISILILKHINIPPEPLEKEFIEVEKEVEKTVTHSK